MPPQTHTDPTSKLLIVATRDIATLDHTSLEELVERARRAHVLVVAPAQAVPGERWIIDVTAREAQARRRLEAWRVALERHAGRVETQIGDADARLARADAQRAFAPDSVLLTMPTADPALQRSPSARRRRWSKQQRAAGALPVAA